MRAALLRALGQPLEIAEVPTPAPGPGEVLVATRTCGVCRTDLHIQDGLAYVPSLPHIPGHEPAGIVAAVGSGVTAWREGDRVVPHLFVRDGECRYTRSGQHAQALHLGGIIGVTRPGGFAEFFLAPAANLLSLPAAVPFDVGGLVSCAVITAVHAYRKAALQAGETALVLGAGGIGLILIQLLHSAGVRCAALSRSAASVQLAQAARAELAVRLDDPDAVPAIRQFCGADADGVDCVFELVGLARTMALAADCVARCGQIVVIGEEAEFPAIDTVRIAQRELRIVGARNGGLQDALDALQLLARGVIRPPIAARYPLTQINAALAAVRSGQAHGRTIVEI